MEINVFEDSKIVEIWLNHKDQNDEQLNADLKQLYAVYNTKKYKVAVFKSGKGDLCELTSQLLLCNRNYLAGSEDRQHQ